MRAVFNECVDEPIARVVILTGPPGIGKTRICHEFLAGLSNLDPPAEVWYGRGQPSTAGAPLAMLAMGLRIMAHLVDGEDPQVSRQKLVARVSRHVPEERARGVAEFLGELVGSPFSAVESPGLRAARQDPVLMAQRVRSAWEELLAAECASQPVVLVLEDLHWGDVATVKFVDGALRRFADKPLFVLATAPSTGALDAFPNLWAERAPLETRLTPLTPKASERLLRAFLGSATDSTIAALVQHGAGNPLFLEELIRAYATGDDTELPETLLAMTQSRLERLDAEPRRALRAASVFGMSFTKDGLGALLGETYGAGDLERSLTYLSEAELIEPNVDAWPNHGYTFRQDIIRRAAYSMLTEEDRILGHGLAARWLVEKAMGSPSEIAKHFDEGGQAERAARWYLAAAEEAFRASDFVAVLDWTDRAMMLGAQGELRGALLALQTAIGLARNEVEEAEYIGADAMALLPPGSARWCQVAGTTGVIALMLRPSRHLEEVHERLLAQVPAADAYAAHATALAAVGLLYARIGDHEVLTRIATVAEKSAAQLDSVDVATLGRIALLNTYLAGTHEGDAYAHLTFAQDAELAFAKLDDPAYAISIGTEIGWALLTLGAYEAAEERLRGVIAHAHRNGMTLQAAYVGLFHALALAHLGQGERAAQLAHESRTYCASRLVDALAAPILGRIAMLRGDFTAAEHALEGIEALDTSMNLLHAEACVVRAWLLLEQGNAPEALRLVRAIVAWSDRPGGAGHNEGLMRLIYVRSLEAVGDVDGARAELRVARERLSARAATIGDATLRSSFLERVPENAATLTLTERLG